MSSSSRMPLQPAMEPLLPNSSGLGETRSPGDMEMNYMERGGVRDGDLSDDGKVALPAFTTSFETEHVVVNVENEDSAKDAGSQLEPPTAPPTCEEDTDGEPDEDSLLLAAEADCKKWGVVSESTRNLIQTCTSTYGYVLQLFLIAFAASLLVEISLKANGIDSEAARIVMIILGILNVALLAIYWALSIPLIKKSILLEQPTLSKIDFFLHKAWILDALETVFVAHAGLLRIFGADFHAYIMLTDVAFLFWAFSGLPFFSHSRYATLWLICELSKNFLLPAALFCVVAFNLRSHIPMLNADHYGDHKEISISIFPIGNLVFVSFALLFVIIPACRICWDALTCGRDKGETVEALTKLHLIHKSRLVCRTIKSIPAAPAAPLQGAIRQHV